MGGRLNVTIMIALVTCKPFTRTAYVSQKESVFLPREENQSEHSYGSDDATLNSCSFPDLLGQPLSIKNGISPKLKERHIVLILPRASSGEISLRIRSKLSCFTSKRNVAASQTSSAVRRV